MSTSLVGGKLAWTSSVLVCEKCGDKMHPHVQFTESFRKNLKTALKNLESHEGEHLATRVMRSSCQGVCPEGGLSICLTSERHANQSWVLPLESGHFSADVVEDVAQEINQILVSYARGSDSK